MTSSDRFVVFDEAKIDREDGCLYKWANEHRVRSHLDSGYTFARDISGAKVADRNPPYQILMKIKKAEGIYPDHLNWASTLY